MRVMDLEMRTWYGAPAYFVLGAVHAIGYWITVSFLTPFVLLVGLFNDRRRCCTTCWSARSSSTTRRARSRCAGAPRRYAPNRLTATRFDAGAIAKMPAGRIRPARLTTVVTQHSRDTPQFYLTAPSPCPYLPGKEERKVFTHLVGERAPAISTICSPMAASAAASRSPTGRPARPAAPASRCASIVGRFRPTRSMRRIARPQRRLVGEMRVPVPTSEQYSVFRAYLDARHRDGGMADMTVLDYAMMVEDSHVETRHRRISRRGPGQPHQRARHAARCSPSRSPTC